MGFVKDCKCRWCQQIQYQHPIEGPPLSTGETIELAAYKKRLENGIVHTVSFQNRMTNLQDRFDQHRDCRK